MTSIVNRLATAAKAIVAAATPIVVAAVTDVLGELTIIAQGAVTGAATAVTVYLTRNRPAA